MRANLSPHVRRLAEELHPIPIALPAIVLIGMAAAGLSWSFDHTTYDTWGGLLVLLAILLASFPVLRMMARHEDDVRVRRLFAVALVLKLCGALARLAVTFGLYDGNADASTYHDAGVRLAPLYRQLDFSGELSGGGSGTAFLQQLTGWLYVFIGPTKLGGFLVFAWFGFLGLYAFYRAFRLAVPDGDHWRYARLVFLLPSLLFWPSSIGKEAWMVLMLGIGAYGAARIYAALQGGFVILLIGIAGLSLVRPHVAALLLVGAFAAFLLRRAPSGASITSPLAKLCGVIVLGGSLVLAVGAAETFFAIDSFDAEAVQTVLTSTAAQTSQGGSQFGASEPTNMSPSKLPAAMVGVLFRPFPWESGNAQGVIAALEGTGLLVLFALSWRQLVGAVRSSLVRPYVLLCCTYSLVFIYAFSSFANFGILTRQRVQLFPFVLVLICLPPWRRRDDGWRSLLVEVPSARHSRVA